MRFASGLKEIYKTPIYAFLITLFLVIWIFVRIGLPFIRPYQLRTDIAAYTIWIGYVFMLFLIILFVISFFRPVRGLHFGYLILAFIASVIIAFPRFPLYDFIFTPIFDFFFIFSLYANIIVTAFFAFRFCMDTATKFDDFFYRKEKSRKVTRTISFILFGVILGFLSFFARWIFGSSFNFVFQIIFWINGILLIMVIIRAIVVKKFAAYVSFFFLLTFFYLIYIIFKIIEAFVSEPGAGGASTLLSLIIFFVVDFLLFIYIIGSLYDRIDYIKEKIKVFRAETIALFIIIMKIFVELYYLGLSTTGLPAPEDIYLEIGLFIVFAFFTLLFGMHSIFKHESGVVKEEEEELDEETFEAIGFEDM